MAIYTKKKPYDIIIRLLWVGLDILFAHKRDYVLDIFYLAELRKKTFHSRNEELMQK